MQFKVSLGEDFPANLPMAFFLLCGLMWFYVIFMRMLRRVGFEIEIIAFFLSTLSLAVTASSYPGSVFKQAALYWDLPCSSGSAGICAILTEQRK